MPFFYIHCRRIEKELKNLGKDLIELSHFRQPDRKLEEKDRYDLEDECFVKRINDKADLYIENITKAVHSRRSLINKILPKFLVYLPISRTKIKEMQLFVHQYQEYLERENVN